MNTPSQIVRAATTRRAGAALPKQGATSLGRPAVPAGAADSRVAPPAPAISPASVTVRQMQVEPPRAGSIYQQLMKKHDRMAERHLPKK